MNSKYRSTKPVLRVTGAPLLCVAAMLVSGTIAHAQSILGNNLIVNGNAEAGYAGASVSNVVTIPIWTRTGNVTVLPYGFTGTVLLRDPATKDRGISYFSASADGVSTAYCASASVTQTLYVAVQKQPCRGE